MLHSINGTLTAVPLNCGHAPNRLVQRKHVFRLKSIQASLKVYWNAPRRRLLLPAVYIAARQQNGSGRLYDGCGKTVKAARLCERGDFLKRIMQAVNQNALHVLWETYVSKKWYNVLERALVSHIDLKQLIE
jgi:hypothetical protein